MHDMRTPAGEGGRADPSCGGKISANNIKPGARPQHQGYPFEAASKGSSDTGRAGADQIERRAQPIRIATLAALQRGPATAEQIAEAVGEHFMIVRARCSELRGQGLIQDTGQRGHGALGGKVIVWRLTTAEERAIFAARKAAEVEKRGDT